jgi:hypothetical protein
MSSPAACAFGLVRRMISHLRGSRPELDLAGGVAEPGDDEGGNDEDEAGFERIRSSARTAPTLRPAATSTHGSRTTGVGAQHARRATIAAHSPPANPPEVRQFGILPGGSVSGTGSEPVTSSIGEKHRASPAGFGNAALWLLTRPDRRRMAMQ